MPALESGLSTQQGLAILEKQIEDKTNALVKESLEAGNKDEQVP